MGRSTGIWRLIAPLLAGVFLLLAGVAIGGEVVTKGSKAATLPSCVAPTEEIRRYHMDYLKHERIAVVHEGVRGNKYSIADCVDCHAGRDGAGKAVPVNAEGQFCQKCHNYAAVDIECFQCHRKVPQEK